MGIPGFAGPLVRAESDAECSIVRIAESGAATFPEGPSMRRAASLVALGLLVAAAPSRTAAPGAHVEMTWMSIANWYFQIGGLRIVMDGYITRVPEKIFVPSRQFPNDRYTFTTQPWKPNVADVRRVRRRSAPMAGSTSCLPDTAISTTPTTSPPGRS